MPSHHRYPPQSAINPLTHFNANTHRNFPISLTQSRQPKPSQHVRSAASGLENIDPALRQPISAERQQPQQTDLESSLQTFTDPFSEGQSGPSSNPYVEYGPDSFSTTHSSSPYSSTASSFMADTPTPFRSEVI